ncbi:hypothetical protein ACFV2U_48205 [Streptomyces sp. NPDC059697]|uniref:hypothetical protein n=1 Tax=Streptomyces sp. NPDC059697 TaxID=3346912 RepID=UPI0036B448DE
MSTIDTDAELKARTTEIKGRFAADSVDGKPKSSARDQREHPSRRPSDLRLQLAHRPL